MKNLHKKIGAIALAGIVVFGGFAASGAQSFAAEGKAVVREERGYSKEWKEIQDMIRKARKEHYVLVGEYKNRSEAREAAKKYDHLKRFDKAVRSINEKNFKKVVSGSRDAMIVRYKGKYFILALHRVEVELEERSIAE